MKNTLIMLSGGLDSVYEATFRLKETDENVHLHHIVLINAESKTKHIAEHEVCKKLIPEFKKIRDFTFSESLINHSQYQQIPFDMAIVCFEAGCVSRSRINNPNTLPFTHWTIGTCLEEGHWESRFEKISPIVNSMCWPYDAPKFELGQNLICKKNELKYVNDLNIPFMSCRNPIENSPCGKCFKCIEFKKYE
jgi:7-cyano-7-deazaguanine synthase in queuosine biosynthesis